MSEIVDCIAFIVRKTCWSLYVFTKFLFLRFLDLLGLIFNVCACCTIIRFPFMIAHFIVMKTFWDWRLFGFLQFIIFICDLPIIIMGLIIFVTVIRIYPCCKEIKEEWDGWKYYDVFFTGFGIRIAIIKHFFTLFVDVFCVPSAIVVLLSWRSVRFVRKFKNAKNDWKKRKLCFVEFLQLFVDIPLLLSFLIVVLSWRLPFLIYYIRKDTLAESKWNEIRFRGIKQLFYLFVDIPCLIVFLITLLTWRSPILIWQLAEYDTNYFKNSIQWKLRAEILLQFIYIFVDIPCIIIGMFLAVTMWRLPSTIRGIKKITTKSYNRKNFYKKEFRIRKICLMEFGTIFVDFLCFVMALFILLTLWRTYPLIKDLKHYWKRYRKSLICRKRSYGTFEGRTTDTQAEGERKSDVGELESSSVKVVIEDGGETSTEGITAGGARETNDTDKEKDKPLSWNKCTWKFRKVTGMHFVMFFIDLPAIPLAIILVLTLLRTAKFLSAVIGSGNFYMMFAITVYYQIVRLFVDLCFLVLFFILMIMRPVQSWVHLLEDEEHKKYRILCDIVLWAPDIAADRHKVYDEMIESVTVDIKEVGSKASRNLTRIIDPHLNRLENLLKRVQDTEIEDEFGYILQVLLFLEKKRVNKMMRKFILERNYMQRANPSLHDENLCEWNKEMRDFHQNVDAEYRKLANYKPDKIPLYETKNGLSLRSRKETREVLLQCLPRGTFLVIVMALLCCLPLYRMPTMVRQLFRRWYNRFDIVKNTLIEYALDFFTLLTILLVTVCIYRAPAMLVDIFDCIVEKRSWKSVRSIVKRYPLEIGADIIKTCATLCSWKTPRFIFTAILFGVLMPADLFLTVVKIFSVNACFMYISTALLYVVVIGFPFAFGLYVANYFQEQRDGWMNVVLLCVFVALLLFLLLLMIMALVKDRNKVFLLEMPKCDYVRLSWYNINVFFFEILEFLQTMALIFKLQSIPMYGSTTLETASNYLLFSFLPFKAIFWLTVIIFAVWFFLCAAPIILENILEEYDVGTCSRRSSWRLALSLFANTLFVTIIENLISFSACTYQTCPISNSTMQQPNYTMFNTTTNQSHCLSSTFVEDNSFHCWTGVHRSYATFGLFALVWYSTTSLIFGTQYGDSDTSEQDIGFAPIYNTVVNILKVGMIVAVTIVTDNNYAVIGVLLACIVLLIIFTMSFRVLFNYDACNLPSVLVWRAFTFVNCGIAVVAVLIAFIMDKSDSKIPILIICIGLVITFIAAFVFAVRLRTTSNEQRDRENFRKEIHSLEARLLKNRWLLKKWDSDRKIWSRLVKSVREASKKDKNVKPESWNSPQLASNEERTVPLSYIMVEDTAVGGSTSAEIENEFSSYSVDTVDDESVDPVASVPPPPSYNLSNNCDGIPPPPSYHVAKSNDFDSLIQPNEVSKLSLDVSKLQKNGQNLLLILEKHVRYDAYKYSFLTQRVIWLQAVINSDWTGLLQCLRILNKNIEGTFGKPSAIDVALSTPSLLSDKLEKDPQDAHSPPPVFTKLTKAALAEISEECRRRALDDFAGFADHGTEWSRLLDKVLPTAPVFKVWRYSENISFELISRRPNTGTITEVAESGNKLAKGASFTIGKVLRGSLNESGLSFDEGFEPVAKKGPVKIGVHHVTFTCKHDELYLVANGKKVKYEIAMASCKTVKWV